MPSDTVTVHSPGKVADGDLVTKWGKKYEVYFSNNASLSSLLVGSNTASTTQATGTNKWCNIGSSCGNNNNNIASAFTLDEFVSNVKGDNANKAIRVQSTASSEKNIVMVVSGYDSISVFAKSNDINVYAEIWGGSSYGDASALTVGHTKNASSHYKRQFALDKTKQYRLTIAYGTSGSTNKDIVAFSLCYTPASTPTWCTLSYDANGGSGSIPAQDFISGTTVYASWNCAFSRSGYIFDKWNTETDGTGTSYYPYETFSISANTTLYAQWKPVATSDYYCISIWNADVTGISNFTWWKGNEHVVDLALPNYYTGSSQKHYWVGKDGWPYNSGLGQSNAKSSEAEFWNMPLTASYSTHLEDKAKGVLGRIHVYDNSSYDNLDPQFTPQQWVLMWGAPETSWTTTKMYPSGCENEWISEVVILTSDQISSWKYYAGFLKSDGGGAFMWKSKEETFGAMGIYNKNTDTWTSGNVSGNLSAGSTGHFRLWSNATSYDNWRCHFVVDYALKYNANNGTGAPATVYVPAEGDDSHRTVKLSTTEPTRSGYSFEGWATSSSRASSGTVDYAAGAYITVGADTELFAVWECVTPTIGTDLSTSTVNYYVGASASALTVAATAGGGTVSYQWYSNTANSTTSPTPTSLTTGTSYAPSTASAGTTYYFCVVTNTTGSCSTTATSNITPVTVSRKTPTAYSVTGTASICSGGNTDITLSGSQVGASYQLKKDGSASGEPVSGTGNALVWNVSATGAYTVSAVQTTAFTAGDMSGTATVSLKTATSVSFSDYTLDAAVDEEFEITGISAAGSGTLTYLWYSYSDAEGSDEKEIDGADEESYTFTPDAEGDYYFKCEVTGTCGSVKSELITVTATVACSAPAAPSISGTTTYTVGDDISLTATCASGADASTTYTWYKGADWAAASASSPVQAAATGSSGYTLTIDDCTADAKGKYWCEASNGSGCEAHNATGYAIDVPLGDDHVLIWNMTFTDKASSLYNTHSESSTSSYLGSQAALTTTGMSALGSDGKSDATPKLENSSSEDNTKCAYVTFTVTDGYQFTPDSVILSTTAVSNDKNIVVEMGSNKQTWAQTKSESSTPTKHNYIFSSPKACTGTVTLKIHAYNADYSNKFRIGSPIKIYGTVSAVSSHTVTYDDGGATSGSVPTDANTYEEGDEVTVLGNTGSLKKTGHDFDGWSDGVNTYDPGDTFDMPDEDVTLTAQWTPKTYTITYKEEDKTTVIEGLTPSTYTFNEGKVTLPTPADSTCHTFDGWYKSTCVDGGSGFISDCKRTEISNGSYGDYTFYGKWTLNSHTLTWNFNGGTTEDSYTAGGSVNCGADLTIPTLTKTGYTFDAWSSTPSVMPDNDLTLAASWTANTYTVTLDPDNGNSTSTVTATYDAAMPSKLSDGKTDVTVPTYTGYTFGGYYDDHAGAGTQYYTNSVASANNWDKTSATTLYAKWTQTVTLKTGSKGSGSDLTPTVLYKGTALSGFSSGHTAKGYRLLGYYTASSEGTKVLNADGTFAASNVTDYITGGAWTKAGATTLYAQWEDMEITLPGTLDKDNYIEIGGGAKFSGDYFDYSHGDNNHRDGYAEWKVNVAQKCVYTVTINGNYTSTGRQWKLYLISGSDTISTCPFDAKYDTGDQSYTKNWDLSGIAATGTYIIRLKNTLEWGAGKVLSVVIDPIKVTYDANGGTCGTEYAYYAGSALTLPTPTRDGYFFKGWYDGETKEGDAGDSYTPDASTTLTAQWAIITNLPGTLDIDNYAEVGGGLTFNGDTLNYGTGTGSKLDGYTEWKVNVAQKCVYKVTLNGKYPNGHQWEVYLVDGSGDTESTCTIPSTYTTGAYTETKNWDLSGIAATGTYIVRVKNIMANGEPKLLSVTIDPITVTYDANGGTCGTASAYYAGSALTLPIATRSGYTFEGWYSAGTKIGDADDDYTPDPVANITLYAHWTDDITGKVFSYIDGVYGDKYKAFDASTWVTSDGTDVDKTYTNASTDVQFVIDDGYWDNKTGETAKAISSLAKFKKDKTSMSVVIPTGKIATVKIGYGAFYDAKNSKNYGPLTIGGVSQTAISTALENGLTNAEVDAALKEITLNDQTGTLTLGSSYGNIYIGRVSATITGYVITYAAGDYGTGESFTGTKTAGSDYTISDDATVFTRANYTHGGWSTSADGSTKDYDFGDTYSDDAALTLYPYWEASCADPDEPTGFSAGSITDGGVTFSITDEANAGNYDIYYNTSSTPPTGSTDATTTATSKSKAVTGLSAGTTYYAWVRAVCDEDHKSDWVALNPAGDTHTFTTHYTVTMGTVTTRQHEGSTVGGTISSDVSHAAAGGTVTLTATPTSGYAFIAWKIVDGSSVDKTDNLLSDSTLVNPSFTMPAYGVTVNATFAKVHTITYKDHDKTTVLDGLVPTSYVYGVGVASLPTPTKTGYTFDSWYSAYCVDTEHKGDWYDGCKKTSIGTSDYGNATYYASWTVNNYTLTWDFDGGSTSDDDYTSGSVAYGTTLDYPADNTMSKEGYDFAGWSTDATTMPAEALTITAQWVEQYTVTYIANGGSCATSSDTGSSVNSVTLPTPTRTDYDFLGWYNTAGTKVGNAGAEFTPTSDTTLYAKWQGSCASTPAVLFSQNFNSATTLDYAANTARAYTIASGGNNIVGSTAASQFTSITCDAKNSCGLGQNTSTGGNSENWTGKFGAYFDNTGGEWSIIKTSDFASTAPTALKIEMKAKFSYLSSGTNIGVQFAVGSSFGDGLTTSCPALTNCVAGFALPSNSTIRVAKYVTSNAITDIDGKSATLTDNTECIYTWVINNTASSLSYSDPAGGTSSVAAGCWDLWIGTSRNLAGVSQSTTGMSGTTMQNLYIGSPFGKKNKFVLDSIVVTDLKPACYQVTYDGNGATSGYVDDPVQHTAGSLVIVPYPTSYSYQKSGGYEFNGWNTKADGSGDDYEYYSYPNDHFTITQDTTLYAQWRIVIDENTSNLTAYEDPAHKDVRVTNGAKLTLTQDTTVRNMLVETGSTLNVAKDGEEGIQLTAKRLSLQGGWGTVGGETKYDMPRVYIDPASKIKKRDTIINFDLAVNNACYYPFALPFDVPLKISAGKDYSQDSCMVDYTHHTLAYYSNYGANGQFAIKTYDGQSRANNGATSANWKHVAAGTTLKAGHGYALTAIALGGIYGDYAVIRFPMKVDNAWLTAGEIGHYTDAKAVEHIKDTVHVTAYKKAGTGEGTGDQTPKANIGWNLLGVPYMACYTTSDDMYDGSNVDGPATLIKGRFNYTTNKWEDGDIMYVTVPVHDFSEYVQADITDSDTKLLPGWCFFVQVAETGNLRFLSASETESSSLPIYAPKREKADMPTVKTGIILSGAEASDKTTILVSDRYSAAEYEINADLEKMFGENSYTLATYSLSGETRLAYNAMSNADAANIIPIGYRAPAEGSYTFAINPRYAQNEAFEHVNLIDYETGFVTDLLQASYTFSSDRTQNDSRFALNVVKIKETPTGIENGADGATDAKGVRKLLLNDKLYIILDNKMYDATGRMVK